MRKLFAILLLLVPTAAAGGCAGTGLKDDFAWSVRLPRSRLNRGEPLAFIVETRSKDGRELRGVNFKWSVDWVGLNGSRHSGASFVEEEIRSKGGAGTAHLRIYALDSGGRLVQVLRQPFEMD